MADSSLLIERDGAIARLVLNRPQRLNALDRALLADLSEALGKIVADGESRVVVLSGSGGAFCSGQDLLDPGALEDSTTLRDTIERYHNPVIRQLRDLPLPVIAAVDGVAAGAGASLALACDFIIASDKARFDFGFARIGLIPGAGCSWLLHRSIGRSRAASLLLLGDSLDARQAADWGLIQQVVAAAALGKAVDALARRLAAMPTLALGLAKRVLDAAAHQSLEAQLALEAQWQGEAADSEDFREGLAAFREKRAPRFFGR